MEESTFDHEIITSTGQYENVTTHFCGSPEDAVALSQRIKLLVKEGAGVEEREVNFVFDKMLSGEGVNGGMDIYERMTNTQKYAVQALKRALKRKEGKKLDTKK